MKKEEPMKAGEDKAGKDFMPVLMENYEAMKMAKAGNMKDVLTSEDPFDCILETYDDLIFLYKKYQPVVNTEGNWKECRCDNPNHYCFVHHQWGKLSESVSVEGKEAVGHLLSIDKGMRWVKASERLPEINDVVFVRVYIDNKFLHKDSAYYDDLNFWRWNTNDEQISKPVVATLEWLDESSESVDKDKEMESEAIAYQDTFIEELKKEIAEGRKEIERLVEKSKRTDELISRAEELLQKSFLKAKEPLATNIYEFLQCVRERVTQKHL